jgi:hypothetical protein
LLATKLNEYLSVTNDGWIVPRLCIYGVFLETTIPSN